MRLMIGLGALAAAILPAMAQGQGRPILAYPAMTAGGEAYAVRADDSGKIVKCQRVAGGPVTPKTQTDCATLIAKGIPATVTPARSTNDPSTWVTDYPKSALQKNESGAAEVAYEVSADGRVRECRILATTGNKAIDAAACASLIARARFTPATYKGTPVPAVRIDIIRMWIP